MSDLGDPSIPLSQLRQAQDGDFILPSGTEDQLVLSGLLTHTLRAAAMAAAAPAEIELVSIATDATGRAEGGQIVFSTQIDRQTRTLIFLSGDAREEGAPRLRGTAIFRVRGR